ncbi:MAG: efflux RND transporter periplasmic adaptor subunit [Chloroflexi bacterium]|nr:efflux RND transporter periplasmic adaptor subunit [Chloroflexota bacterium]
MQHRPPKQVIFLVILLVLGIGGYYIYTNYFSTDANSNIASGFIEGEDVSIAAEIGGRIEAINVNEGEPVTAGQELVRLDRTLLNAQIAQAQAAIDTAKAQLTQIKNGPRMSDVSAARAALDAAQKNHDKLRAGGTASDVAAAQAALDAANKNYDKVRAGPTQDQLAQLKAQVDSTKAAVDQAQSAYDRAGGSSNPLIGLTPQSLALQQASNAHKAATSALNDALTHPTASELAAAKSQVDQAQAALARLTADAAQLAAAKSQVDQAQAALDRLTPTADTISIAENQVKQAQAALGILQVQVKKMTLTSPVNGTVTRRAVSMGEIAAPNATLLSVTNLDTVKLTIYVPETEIGKIKLGDEFDVRVDSFPEQIFKGKVVFINTQAEFTPRNVQTKAERVNTVFAVKLQLSNPNFALKPGMPADATLK